MDSFGWREAAGGAVILSTTVGNKVGMGEHFPALKMEGKL